MPVGGSAHRLPERKMQREDDRGASDPGAVRGPPSAQVGALPGRGSPSSTGARGRGRTCWKASAAAWTRPRPRTGEHVVDARLVPSAAAVVMA